MARHRYFGSTRWTKPPQQTAKPLIIWNKAMRHHLLIVRDSFRHEFSRNNHAIRRSLHHTPTVFINHTSLTHRIYSGLTQLLLLLIQRKSSRLHAATTHSRTMSVALGLEGASWLLTTATSSTAATASSHTIFVQPGKKVPLRYFSSGRICSPQRSSGTECIISIEHPFNAPVVLVKSFHLRMPLVQLLL